MTEQNLKVFSDDVALINSVIENLGYLKCTSDRSNSVIAAEKYGLCAGGKRIRPVLCLEFYKLFGGKEDISEIAACLELIHTFSLIHDDMPEMDNDSMRRGKPSVHAAYGADIALLAGDGLSLLPFEIISANALAGKISYETAVKLTSYLSCASGNMGMIMGQMLDIISEGQDVDIEFLKEMSAKKTGFLLMASAAFGAILAGAEQCDVKRAEEYAANLGMSFQIVDDILDVIGTESELGKPIGSDKIRNKNTFADVLGIDKAYELAQRYTESAVAQIKDLNGSQLLCELASDLVKRRM